MSLTVVTFWTAMAMQMGFLTLLLVPSQRVTVTCLAVSRTVTRSRTWQGSTPDHQVTRRLRPSLDGFAESHRTLRGLSVWPWGLVGLGTPPVGSVRGATVWLTGWEGLPAVAEPVPAGPAVVAPGSAPQPSASSRVPVSSGIAIIRIILTTDRGPGRFNASGRRAA